MYHPLLHYCPTWSVSLELGPRPVSNNSRPGWRRCPRKPNFSRHGPARNHAQHSWRRWAKSSRRQPPKEPLPSPSACCNLIFCSVQRGDLRPQGWAILDSAKSEPVGPYEQEHLKWETNREMVQPNKGTQSPTGFLPTAGA